MGIKNLKSVLLEQGSLRKLETTCKHNVMYIDFMSFFIPIAYSSRNVEELTNSILSRISIWKRRSRSITLFVDDGAIAIKTSLRESRKSRLLTQCLHKRELERTIQSKIESLSTDDDLFFEKRESMQVTLDRIRFFLFLSESNNLYKTRSDILSIVSSKVNIVYSVGIDAEFDMCRKAHLAYTNTGVKWPIIFSNDQDALCFATADMSTKTILSNGLEYKLSPSAISVYLVKLTILVNGCDFYQGLEGISIDEKSIHKYRLFEVFSIDNVIISLLIKPYHLTDNTYVNVIDIINFVDMYARIDDAVYEIKPPPRTTIRAFLRNALLPLWFPCQLSHRNSVVGNLIILLLSLKTDNVCNHTRLFLRKMAAYYDNTITERPTKITISIIAQTLGFQLCDPPGLVAVCLKTREVLKCYGIKYCFNPNIIIENKQHVINIKNGIFASMCHVW